MKKSTVPEPHLVGTQECINATTTLAIKMVKKTPTKLSPFPNISNSRKNLRNFCIGSKTCF